MQDFGTARTVRVTLLLFAQFREALGGRTKAVDLHPGTTAAQLLASVASGNSRLEALKTVTRFIVNDEFVTGDHELADGDEVAFVPPVAGG